MNFLQWAQAKLLNKKEEDFNISLDDLSEHLFPETDPVLWAEVLTFVMVANPSFILDRVRFVINEPKIFGLGGRMRSFSSGQLTKEEFEKRFKDHRVQLDHTEELNTIRLAHTLMKILDSFEVIFSVANLTVFIRDAEALKNDLEKDPIKLERIKRLLIIFHGLGSFISGEDSDSKIQ